MAYPNTVAIQSFPGQLNHLRLQNGAIATFTVQVQRMKLVRTSNKLVGASNTIWTSLNLSNTTGFSDTVGCLPPRQKNTCLLNFEQFYLWLTQILLQKVHTNPFSICLCDNKLGTLSPHYFFLYLSTPTAQLFPLATFFCLSDLQYIVSLSFQTERLCIKIWTLISIQIKNLLHFKWEILI